MDLITKKMRIQGNHPVREELAKSLACYHDSLNGAVHAINTVLRRHGMEITDCRWESNADEGRETFTIWGVEGAGLVCSKCAEEMGVVEFENVVAFSWYKMNRSGRYEITAYIS